MLLKRVNDIEKRKAEGLETLQEKVSKSQLAKLGCNIMHRTRSGGVKNVEV